MEYLPTCPICTERAFSPYISCKDYTVSQETFALQKCDTCGFVLTNPRPEESQISKYYQSEAYISHSDTSKGLIDKLYRIARSFTLKWKFDLVQKNTLTKPSSILDYGCGNFRVFLFFSRVSLPGRCRFRISERSQLVPAPHHCILGAAS